MLPHLRRPWDSRKLLSLLLPYQRGTHATGWENPGRTQSSVYLVSFCWFIFEDLDVWVALSNISTFHVQTLLMDYGTFSLGFQMYIQSPSLPLLPILLIVM